MIQFWPATFAGCNLRESAVTMLVPMFRMLRQYVVLSRKSRKGSEPYLA